MIAPLAGRPRIPRQHALEIQQQQQQQSQLPRRIGRVIESHPVPAIALAIACGAALGWLVKRKRW